MHKNMWITKRWEHPEKRLYYQAQLQESLLGWEVFRCWGRINQTAGNSLVIPCESYEAAMNQLLHVEKQRQRSNYELVSNHK